MKRRLDVLIQEQFNQYSRQNIQSWIMQGKVFVNGVCNTKAGSQIAPDASITFHKIDEERFVSRAGYKLEKALDHFNIDVTDLVALDAGISTGGFTDCLLQRGIQHVFGVDVGYGQIHEKIRNNNRLTLMERTNLRYLNTVEQPIDVITLDLSFISISKVMKAVCSLLKNHGKLITLIKPQFEATRSEIGKGGIIKDPAVHEKVVKKVVSDIESHGFILQGTVESPILGGSGNKEFLAYFIR